jgi:hypothetical protein
MIISLAFKTIIIFIKSRENSILWNGCNLQQNLCASLRVRKKKSAVQVRVGNNGRKQVIISFIFWKLEIPLGDLYPTSSSKQSFKPSSNFKSKEFSKVYFEVVV